MGCIIFSVHLCCGFIIFQFVRFYERQVYEKWFIATLWTVVHRFFTAPSVRTLWVFVVLIVSRVSSTFDLCLARSPHITTFPKASSDSSSFAADDDGAFDNDVDVDM